MKVRGSIWRSGNAWEVECLSLQANTQGRTRADALDMMKDWVQTVIGDESFEFDVEMDGKDEFVMTFPNPKPILALMVERNRAVSGLSLRDIAELMGKKSASSVTSLLSGKHDPGFETLSRLFAALGHEIEIRIAPKQKSA